MTKLLDLKENCVILIIDYFHINLNLYLLLTCTLPVYHCHYTIGFDK